jgi:hypothetical protein
MREEQRLARGMYAQYQGSEGECTNPWPRKRLTKGESKNGPTTMMYDRVGIAGWRTQGMLKGVGEAWHHETNILKTQKTKRYSCQSRRTRKVTRT